MLSYLLCEGKCEIKSEMKYLSNPNEKNEKKNIFSFLKSFSLFSCFYGIYPGEYTEIYLLNTNLINMYISIMIISEKKEFRSLMQIFGLHPFIYWISTFSFHFLLSIVYSFYLYLIFSFNDHQNLVQNNLTFEFLLKKSNLEMKKGFFLYSFVNSITNIPFIYLMTSSFLFVLIE